MNIRTCMCLGEFVTTAASESPSSSALGDCSFNKGTRTPFKTATHKTLTKYLPKQFCTTFRSVTQQETHTKLQMRASHPSCLSDVEELVS
eukprot:3166296-Amphidinium_carterae.1